MPICWDGAGRSKRGVRRGRDPDKHKLGHPHINLSKEKTKAEENLLTLAFEYYTVVGSSKAMPQATVVLLVSLLGTVLPMWKGCASRCLDIRNMGATLRPTLHGSPVPG